MKDQEYLRSQCKRLKWEEEISYKEMAEHLDLKYNSFMNFICGYKNLGERSVKRLEEFIIDVT